MAKPLRPDRAARPLPRPDSSFPPSRSAQATSAPARSVTPNHHAVSTAGVYEIQVCLNEDDGVRVAGTLTHELIHACGVWNHGKAFRDAGRALGLEGKPTEMGWDHGDADRLPAWARKIVGKLGTYPAGRISLRSAAPAEPGKPGGKPSPRRQATGP